MIIAKLGMGLLGMALKKGAGTAVKSGLSSSLSSGLAQTALSSLTGVGGGKGGGKGGGMGGGKGGGKGGGRSGQGGMGGSKGQGGKGQSAMSSKGQGGRKQNDDSLSLESLVDMLMQDKPQSQVPHDQESVALAPPADMPHEALQAVPEKDNSDTQRQELTQAIAILNEHIVSFSAGRVRIRHPRLKQNQDFALLQQALLKAGMTEITCKASTASALILYDAKRFSKAEFFMAVLPLAHYLAGDDLAL